MIRIVKKFRSIMTHEQQMRILLLGFLMVIGGILEMLGVSMVLPLMTAVMDKNFMEKSYVQTLCSIFRISTYYEVMMLLLGALIFCLLYTSDAADD